MNTGTFIKESRRALGLTQQQLSEIIQKDRTNISLYESGKTTPPGNVVLMLIELRFPDLCLSHSHKCITAGVKKQPTVGKPINAA